ncbi:MAG: folylpolyglutamate synthase/dihydrofolate synthase family protein [Candidatus Micrarchaeia archaeon]
MKNLEKYLDTFGSVPGLSRIKKLLNIWGNPQDGLRVILITGTNGKGSAVSYLSSILKRAGYRVGSYFSPHLLRYNERIRINGKEISDKDFKKYEKTIISFIEEHPTLKGEVCAHSIKSRQVRSVFNPPLKRSGFSADLAINYYKKGNKITLFEALTSIAYKYFSDNLCDFAVMEIGMGGRLDATNIANEKIGIITSVGLEHTKHLGNTIEKIAYEKAGIIKKGIGICGEEKKEAVKVIENECRKRKKKVLFLNREFRIKNIRCFENKTIFDYYGKNNYKNLQLKMIGKYQAQNASLAVKASEILGIGEKKIRTGLKEAKINGRMQIISKNPKILLDVAHNPHGINGLIENLKLFKYSKLRCVFAVMKDKDWKKMTDMLTPYVFEWIFPKTDIKRATDPKNLKKHLKKGKVFANTKDALKYVRKTYKKKELILVCGSIYFAEKLFKSL